MRRSDDYSEQFSDPEDPRFWIRIEKPLGDTVVLSDVLFGEQDEYRMASAIGQALETLGLRRSRKMIFKHLGPASEWETGEKLARMEKVVEALVTRQRRFIVARKPEVERGKVSLVVSFKSFD